MSSEIIEAPHESPQPEPTSPAPEVKEHGEPAAHEEEAPTITAPLHSGSSDDLSLALAAKPDPLLGEFDPEAPEAPPPVAEAAVEPEAPRSSAELDALEMEKPLPLQPFQPPGSFDAVGSAAPAEAAVESPVRRPSDPDSNISLSSGSFDELSGLKVSPEPPSALANPFSGALAGIDTSAATPTTSPARAKDDDDEDDDDYDDEPQGTPLSTVLLWSYTSAVTIALIYILWTGKRIWHEKEPDFLPPIDERVDPGQRAKFSRRLAPPPPITAEHMATLGKPLTVGAVEITPVAVTSGPIVLKHMIGGNETRNEGSDALKLHLKVRNISKDLVFAPLDEAFLREREAGVTDTYIEMPEGANIEMHPLAVTSEWEIVGQQFKELKPGETLDSQLVSTKDALSRKAPEMTWRIRVRTGIDQTEFVGVRFTENDIKPGS